MTFIFANNRDITVSIGNGGLLCTTLPFYVDENYSYSQQIYLQSEINLDGYQVEKIIFTSGNGEAFIDDEVIIYLGHTNQENFSSTSNWIPLDQFTQVFSGAIYTPANGDVEIELDTPFPYNNTQNLVIAFDENTPGNPGSYQPWCAYGYYGHNVYASNGNYEYRSWRTWEWSDIDPESPFQSNGGNEILSARSNIKFIMTETEPQEELPVDYASQIQPILNENCTSCHGYAAGLNLSSYTSVIAGGNSGNIVVPGDHASSVLWQRIDNGTMPPTGNLSSTQINLIAQWIDEGALEEPDTNFCGLMGDFNEDGIINVMDIISTVNIVLDTADFNECVDMNGDGLVNVLDILSIVNIILDN